MLWIANAAASIIAGFYAEAARGSPSGSTACSPARPPSTVSDRAQKGVSLGSNRTAVHPGFLHEGPPRAPQVLTRTRRKASKFFGSCGSGLEDKRTYENTRKSASFDDSEWTNASTYSADGVGVKGGFNDITWSTQA